MMVDVSCARTSAGIAELAAEVVLKAELTASFIGCLALEYRLESDVYPSGAGTLTLLPRERPWS